MGKSPRFDTPYDKLCHHMRNGIVRIKAQSRRMENAFIQFQLEEKGEVKYTIDGTNQPYKKVKP